MNTPSFPARSAIVAFSLGLAYAMPVLAQSTPGTDVGPATSAIQATPTPTPSEPAASTGTTATTPSVTATEPAVGAPAMETAPPLSAGGTAATTGTATTGTASTGSATPLPSETIASNTQNGQQPENDRDYGWVGLLGLLGLLGLRRKHVDPVVTRSATDTAH